MSNTSLLIRGTYAAALVTAPLLLSAAMLSDITPDADGTKQLLELIAERPSAWTLGQALFLLSALAWLPAGLALMRLFGGRTPSGRWGGLLVLIGGLAVLPTDAAGLYLRPLAASSVPIDEQVEIVEAVEGSVAVIAFETVHVVGLFIGLLVVGVAMLRSRVVSKPVAIAVIAALVGLIVNLHPAMEAVSTALLVLGLGAAGLRILRLSDEEWLGGARAVGVPSRETAMT